MTGLDVDMQRLDELCGRYGVARLEVFGSVARGDADASSDLDLLYELAPGAKLGWEIEDLQGELSRLFGRPVELVSKRALHRRWSPPCSPKLVSCTQRSCYRIVRLGNHTARAVELAITGGRVGSGLEREVQARLARARSGIDARTDERWGSAEVCQLGPSRDECRYGR
jgi:predicted nucleotidyltransferase